MEAANGTAPYDPFALDSGTDPAAAVITLLFTLLAIVPNFIVFISLVTSGLFRTCYDCLVINMSLTNVVTVSVIGVIVEIKYARGVYPGRWETCYIQSFSALLNPAVNLLTVAALSAERCLAIKKPFLYRLHFNSRKVTLGLLALIWILSLLFASLPLATGQRFVLKDAFCQPRWSTEENKYFGRVSVAVSLCFVVLMIVLNTLTVQEIIRLHRKRANDVCNASPIRNGHTPHENGHSTMAAVGGAQRLAAERLREKWRATRARTRLSVSSSRAMFGVADQNDAVSVTRMIIVVTFLFVACFVPLLIRILIETGQPPTRYNSVFTQTTNRLMVANAIINPFLFCLLRRVYRYELKLFFQRLWNICRCRRKKEVEILSPSPRRRHRRPSQVTLASEATATEQTTPSSRLRKMSIITMGTMNSSKSRDSQHSNELEFRIRETPSENSDNRLSPSQTTILPESNALEARNST